MSKVTASSTPRVDPHIERCRPYPQLIRRTFECGHPDEFIEVQWHENGERVHNLITLEVFQDCTRYFGSCPVYIHARCLSCAKQTKEQDDRGPNVLPKRTLGTYQVGTSSRITAEPNLSPLKGLDGVLEKYRNCDNRNTTLTPHPRISEDEHRAHRLEMQGEAVASPGRWLAVPVRRVRNMPIQTIVKTTPASCERDTSHACKDKETSHSLEPDEVTGKGVTGVKTGVDIVEGMAQTSLAYTSESNDESFRVAAVNTTSLSGSKLERQKRKLRSIENSGDLESIMTNGDRSLLDHAIEVTLEVASPGRRSAFVDHLIDRNGSSFDGLSESSLADRRFEHPRPAPVVPTAPVVSKKDPLDFTKRRSSTSTRASTKSEPVSKSSRKLRIDIQRSTRSVKKTAADSNSPDFACRTSLAIEAGRISMDSVSIQNRESTTSKHIAEAMRSPEGRHNTYPLPSGERNPASSRYGRHSEGAPQAIRENAAQQSGRLDEKEPSRHDSAQISPGMDLNKSLPALPLQENEKDED